MKKINLFILLILSLFISFETQALENLELVGEGKREKQIFWPNWPNVYYVKLYVEDLETFDRTKPLESLKNQKEALITLEVTMFTGELSRKKLINALVEALERNEVDITSRAIQSLFAYIDRDAKKGDFLYFRSFKIDGTEVIEATAPGKEPILLSQENIIQDIFSIWFGDTTGDEGLIRLKSYILDEPSS